MSYTIYDEYLGMWLERAPGIWINNEGDALHGTKSAMTAILEEMREGGRGQNCYVREAVVGNELLPSVLYLQHQIEIMDRQIAARDKEIEHLRAAIKPALAVDGMFCTAGFKDCPPAVAVRELQRIMKGGAA